MSGRKQFSPIPRCYALHTVYTRASALKYTNMHTDWLILHYSICHPPPTHTINEFSCPKNVFAFLQTIDLHTIHTYLFSYIAFLTIVLTLAWTFLFFCLFKPKPSTRLRYAHDVNCLTQTTNAKEGYRLTHVYANVRVCTTPWFSFIVVKVLIQDFDMYVCR